MGPMISGVVVRRLYLCGTYDIRGGCVKVIPLWDL